MHTIATFKLTALAFPPQVRVAVLGAAMALLAFAGGAGMGLGCC